MDGWTDSDGAQGWTDRLAERQTDRGRDKSWDSEDNYRSFTAHSRILLSKKVAWRLFEKRNKSKKKKK